MKIVDVNADDSCFFRSIYISLRHGRMMSAFMSRLGIRKHPKSEEEFVGFVRERLAKLIETKEDADIIESVYNNLKTFGKPDYKVVLSSSFPSWFRAAFKTLPKSEGTFREKFAAGVRDKSSWASEIEVRILRDHFERDGKYQLVILNKRPSPRMKLNKRTIYVLNIGELHYNAVLPSSKVKEEDSEASCPPQKVMNPETKRCVSRESCKGYEILLKEHLRRR